MNLSNELIQAIMNYLAQRPYGEVFQLITAIQTEAAKQAPQAAEEKVD